MAFNQTIVVDVTHPRNRNPFFRPLRRILQSEVRAANYVNEVPGELMKIGGTLPGERMTVDFKAMSWKIILKLATKEYRELAEQVRKIRATDEKMPENVTFGEEETGRFTSDQVASWLYNLRALVDQKFLTLVSGTLPEVEEIMRMGKIQVSTPSNGIPDKLADRACFLPQTEDKPVAAK